MLARAMQQWFYEHSGQQAGPVDEATFHQMVSDGRVGPTTLVWCEGLPNWQPLEQLRSSGMMTTQLPAIPANGTQPMPIPMAAPVPYYVPVGPVNSGMAIASLICGILGLVTCMAFLGIPAVICGHMAMAQIGRAPQQVGGRGLAIGGLVCGYLQLLVLVFFLVQILSSFSRF